MNLYHISLCESLTRQSSQLTSCVAHRTSQDRHISISDYRVSLDHRTSMQYYFYIPPSSFFWSHQFWLFRSCSSTGRIRILLRPFFFVIYILSSIESPFNWFISFQKFFSGSRVWSHKNFNISLQVFGSAPLKNFYICRFSGLRP